ncbi:hypothetical protein U1Q18_052305, partial [Sarracenia purpurea var. burkii]
KEYYTGVSKVEKSIHEIRMILRTPIRKNRVFCNNNLPDLISNAIETGDTPKRRGSFILSVLDETLLASSFNVSKAFEFLCWNVTFS